MTSKHHKAAQTGHERGSRRVAIEGHTRTLAGQPAILNPRRVVPAVGTNIVVFRLTDDGPDAASVVSRARDPGVLVFAFGPQTVRAVTHLDSSTEACGRAGSMLLEAIEAEP